jgi:serine/threonine-protein kinase
MSDTIAAVLTREIDLTVLPAGTAPHIVALVRRCLERDPRRRLRDIGDARIDLESARVSGVHAQPTTIVPPAPTPTPAASRVWLAVSAALALALAAALAALWRATQATNHPAASIQFDVSPPAGAAVSLLAAGSAADVSQDGSLITMIAVRDGVPRVYVRKRGSVEVKEVPGTEAATDAALSPDGKWLAVWANDALKKLSVDGASAITLANGRAPRGVAWLDNETIIASDNPYSGLVFVPAGGGAPRNLTETDAAKGERSHRWPAAVPGGKAVLFTIGTIHSPDDYNDSQIDAVVVATKVRKKVLDAASFVRSTWDGRLIYARSGVLYSIGFDPERLQTVGAPSAVLPGVEGEVSTGAAHFAIARDGTLVYAPGPGGTNQRRLVWMDRSGAVTAIDVQPGYYNDPDVSHDGRRIAMVVGASGHGDIWLYDSDRKHFGRITFDGYAATPRWSADDRAIYYASIDPASNKTSIVRKEVDAGVAAATVATLDGRAYLGSLASQDAFAVVAHIPVTDVNIVKVPLSPAGSIGRILATDNVEMSPRLSPDGRWLAYVGASPGAPNIYVRELDGQGQWQISTDGGLDPRWSADGRELYYRSETRQMVVPIDLSSGFRPGAIRVLFDGAFNWHTESGTNYGVDPKTGRFLMLQPPPHAGAPVVRVITNWLQSTGGTP